MVLDAHVIILVTFSIRVPTFSFSVTLTKQINVNQIDISPKVVFCSEIQIDLCHRTNVRYNSTLICLNITSSVGKIFDKGAI
jgi:hypothetical protein